MQFGLAISFVVLSGAFLIGPVSGCVLNPAIGLLPLLKGTECNYTFDTKCIVHRGIHSHCRTGKTEDIWVYWVGPICGRYCKAIPHIHATALTRCLRKHEHSAVFTIANHTFHCCAV
jgi:hypothetical protein